MNSLQQYDDPVLTGEVEEVQPGASVEPTKSVSRSKSIDAIAASPIDLPITVFQEALERRRTNRATMLDWIRASLVEGVDYGRIHSMGKSKCQFAAQGMAEQCTDPKHWSKPSLWKPGAEKICGMLGVTVHYPTLRDYEQTALQGVEIKTVILRCELRDTTDRVIADGIGARSLAQDYGDLNKAFKMAEKSAHIDATLRMAGLSEVFTQDLEDLSKERDTKPVTVVKPIGKQSSEHRPPADPPIGSGSPAHKSLEARIHELGLNRDGVKIYAKRQFGVEHFPDLTAQQQRELMLDLPGLAVKKLMKQIGLMTASDLDALTLTPPAWLQGMDAEIAKIMEAADRRLIEIESNAAASAAEAEAEAVAGETLADTI